MSYVYIKVRDNELIDYNFSITEASSWLGIGNNILVHKIWVENYNVGALEVFKEALEEGLISGDDHRCSNISAVFSHGLTLKAVKSECEYRCDDCIIKNTPVLYKDGCSNACKKAGFSCVVGTYENPYGIHFEKVK